MNKKRVLLITNEYPSRVATFITRDIEVLTSGGYEVDLYAIYPKDDTLWDYVPEEGKKLVEEGKLSVKHIGKIEMSISIFCFWKYLSWSYIKEVKEILQQSRTYGIAQCSKSFYAIVWTIALIQKEEQVYNKVVSYWGNYSGTSAYLFSKYARFKTEFYTYLHAGVDLYRDQIYLFEKLLHAKKIITVCQFNVEFLKTLYPHKFDDFINKIVVYHLPLKMKKLNTVTKQKNKIIAVGRLDRKKGVDYLINACAKLKENNIYFSLTLVGDGPERKNLENLAVVKGISDQISFLGHIPYAEVEKEVSSSIVLAHCSPELGDAVPTVIKESLAIGTPVIGSEIVGIPELLDYGKCGLLFKPKDMEGLVKALTQILNERDLQNEMAKKGRKFAEETFDYKKNRGILLNALR